MNRAFFLIMLVVSPVIAAEFSVAEIPADLVVPLVTPGEPAPGKRVRQVQPAYVGSDVHHLLYLPADWQPGKAYPVIVEYAGNQYKTSQGTVEGSSLGYGISGGRGALWVCLPFVDRKNQCNAVTWWGDVEATVAYCKSTVRQVCRDYGGDPGAVVIAGFSRGAIACNYIGLRDNEIAALWCGFLCHSHYDGVKQGWPHADRDRASARARLERLCHTPQLISDGSKRAVAETRAYLEDVYPTGNFTFLTGGFSEHTDTWVLRAIPARQSVRDWFRKVTDHEQRGGF